MTPSNFAAICDDPPDPYLKPEQMARIVRDLLRVLQDLRLTETYWYHEEHTRSGFEALLEALKVAQKRGVRKIRFGHE